MPASYGLTSNSSSAPSLVGRDRELRVLRDALELSLRGRGSLVLVSGEAGIGKTTLVKTLAAEAREQGVLVLTGQAFDLSITPPYGLWVELASHYPERDDLPTPPVILNRGTGVGDLTNQLALFEVVRDFFKDLTTDIPTLLILEDMHWADLASLDLLRFFSRHLENQRLLIVATLRDDELAGDSDRSQVLLALIRERNPERIHLLPLQRTDIQTLVRVHHGLSSADEHRLTQFLTEHSEGNPLYTQELLRTLEEQEFLVYETGSWIVRSLRQVPVPALLRQVIERRLSNLDHRTRELLQVGAVIGAELEIELWQELSEADDEQMSTALRQALVTRLLEENQTGTAIQFTHALIREAVLAGMMLPRRKSLHRRIADILMSRSSQDAEVIANHLHLANDPRAVEWLIKTGDRAAFAFAPLEAVERYENALNLLRLDDSNPSLQGWLLVKMGVHSRSFDAASALTKIREAGEIAQQTGDKVLASYVLFHAGQVLFFMGEGGLPEVSEGIHLLRSLSQAELDLLEEHSSGFDLDLLNTTHAIILALSGHYEQAIEIASATLSESTSENPLHNNERGHGWAAIAHSHCFLGRPTMALAAFEKMHEQYTTARNDLYRALNSTFEFQNLLMTCFAEDLPRRTQKTREIQELWERISGFAAPVAPTFGLLPVMLVEGRWNEALTLGLQHTNEDAIFRYVPLYTVGTITRHQGNIELAWAQVHTGLPHGCDATPGTSWYHYSLQLQQLAVELSLDQSELERATEWLSTHQRWLDWSGIVLMRAEAKLLEARIRLAKNERAAAQEAAGQALTLASSPRQQLALIAIHRFLGELETQSGSATSAETNLQRSLDLAETCAVPFERALTLLAIAELEIERGNVQSAHDHLVSVRRICEPLEARPTLERVAMLQKRTGHSDTSVPFNLTARELEVLTLLSRGMTDRQIAEELFISRHTVMRHVTRILAKLDADTRTAAASIATRDGLV
jgi:DNA-binding CsgD family transcriptional regulator